MISRLQAGQVGLALADEAPPPIGALVKAREHVTSAHWPRARLVVLKAVHIVRHIADTLVDRPLSVANTPFVVDSLRALANLYSVILEQAPGLSEPDRGPALRLAALVRDFLAAPDPVSARQIGGFVRDELVFYAAAMSALVKESPAPLGSLQNRGYDRLLVMIGPGIGIGDEIKLFEMIGALRRGLGLDAGHVELFSFCPSIWRTLTPEFAVAGLARRPLAAFDRLDHWGPGVRPLAVFASFLSQETHRCLAPTDPATDAMAVTVYNGEARLRFAGSDEELVVTRLRIQAPNYSNALGQIARHLCPAGIPAPAGPAMPTGLACKEGRRSFDLVVSPFTSKTSPLSPADWAQFIGLVRRAVPSSRRMSCRILPGLSPSCRQYAEQIRLHARERLGAGAEIGLIDDSQAPLTAEDAFSKVFGALREADLLVTIDTYTAHLSSLTRTVTLTLCLNRNVHFWDPTPYSFWLDTTKSQTHVAVLIRAVASLVARRGDRGGPLQDMTGAAPRLIEQTEGVRTAGVSRGTGAPAGAQSGALAAAMRRRGDAVWASLPAAVQTALLSLDAEYAWPGLGDSLTADNPERRRTTILQVQHSMFWRLAWLATAARSARGTWQ